MSKDHLLNVRFSHALTTEYDSESYCLPLYVQYCINKCI